jgi:predicted RND superfamily exporter protein
MFWTLWGILDSSRAYGYHITVLTGQYKVSEGWRCIMQQLPHIIVKNRRMVLVIALILLIPAVYGMLNARIEYDLMSYLPDDLNSVKGMEILDQKFHYADRAIVVVKDQPDWMVLRLKEDIEQVDGVSSVFWISDLADPAIPPTTTLAMN